ncbi:MAG: formamidopyrimidine-DNA glycosylase, partial [Thermoguttaceae bacterium]|nr:formamidopyrimidine-DNA glycosylase [Thermoguttaceae bacterium]
MRRGILSIVGSRIADVRTPKSPRRPITISPKGATFRRRVIGRQIEAVERAGKRVVVVLDSGDRIVIEPRMTGRIVLCEVPEADFVRMAFDLDGDD